ncbi:hypothetical protein QQ045_015791 [Rhodiola kirilowii]
MGAYFSLRRNAIAILGFGGEADRLAFRPESEFQVFLPGFEAVDDSYPLDFGIRQLDHCVGNVPELAPVVSYLKGFTGFHEFAEFTAVDIGTGESGLNSVVLASNDEMVFLPLNEPIYWTKRKSQIKKFQMQARFDFMPSPPPTYYKNLKNRAGDVLTVEQIKECEELGILVDMDDQGKIFTKPIGDRPTIFIEIIQRVGCTLKDKGGKTYGSGQLTYS